MTLALDFLFLLLTIPLQIHGFLSRFHGAPEILCHEAPFSLTDTRPGIDLSKRQTKEPEALPFYLLEIARKCLVLEIERLAAVFSDVEGRFMTLLHQSALRPQTGRSNSPAGVAGWHQFTAFPVARNRQTGPRRVTAQAPFPRCRQPSRAAGPPNSRRGSRIAMFVANTTAVTGRWLPQRRVSRWYPVCGVPRRSVHGALCGARM